MATLWRVLELLISGRLQIARDLFESYQPTVRVTDEERRLVDIITSEMSKYRRPGNRCSHGHGNPVRASFCDECGERLPKRVSRP